MSFLKAGGFRALRFFLCVLIRIFVAINRMFKVVLDEKETS